jgi:1-aminocyclopropane-1-carboxylate deaminase
LSEADINEQQNIILYDFHNARTHGIPAGTKVAAIRFGSETEAFITDPVYEG